MTTPRFYARPVTATCYGSQRPTALEELEAEFDAAPARSSRGRRRPQALRQARARRTALLRQLGWR